MIRFLARRLLNYVVLLARGFVPDVRADVVLVPAVGQPAAAQPASAAGGDRRQIRRTRPRQADPAALRALGVRAIHGDFGTTVNSQPVADELWRRIG